MLRVTAERKRFGILCVRERERGTEKDKGLLKKLWKVHTVKVNKLKCKCAVDDAVSKA